MKKLVLLFILIIPLIFIVACVNKEVMETYYVTENRTEYYNTIETVAKTVSGEDTLTPKVEESTTILPTYFGVYDSTYSRSTYLSHTIHERVSRTIKLTYKIPEHDTCVLELTVHDLGQQVKLFGYDNYSVDPPPGLFGNGMQVYTIYNPRPQFIVEISGGGGSVDEAKLIWTDVIGTENREVTKERQVPVQVEKQRTVLKKVPFWEAIFH